MSGTASVPNSFAAAVTATGAQLDANYSTIVAYVNDPTNRSNYAAGVAGVTNTFALTFAPPVVGGYTAGLQITFKAVVPNTGAVVINANGLGDASLFSPTGAALAGGEITANQMVLAAHNGTAFQMLSAGAATVPLGATQAQMQTATATAVFASANSAKWHPGSAKSWGDFNGTATGTITPAGSYNVSTIVRAGTGTFNITFANPLASVGYAVSVSQDSSLVGYAIFPKATSGFTILTYNSSTGVAIGPTGVSFMVFGTLP